MSQRRIETLLKEIKDNTRSEVKTASQILTQGTIKLVTLTVTGGIERVPGNKKWEILSAAYTHITGTATNLKIYSKNNSIWIFAHVIAAADATQVGVIDWKGNKPYLVEGAYMIETTGDANSFYQFQILETELS